MNSNCCYAQRCCFAVPTPGIKVGFRRMQGIVSEPLFWSFTSWYFSSIKVQIFWDGHKIWNISPIIFYLSTALSKKLEDFFKKLWPSQNNWTLAKWYAKWAFDIIYNVHQAEILVYKLILYTVVCKIV